MTQNNPIRLFAAQIALEHSVAYHGYLRGEQTDTVVFAAIVGVCVRRRIWTANLFVDFDIGATKGDQDNIVTRGIRIFIFYHDQANGSLSIEMTVKDQRVVGMRFDVVDIRMTGPIRIEFDHSWL